jgi:hypothetical protein
MLCLAQVKLPLLCCSQLSVPRRKKERKRACLIASGGNCSRRRRSTSIKLIAKRCDGVLSSRRSALRSTGALDSAVGTRACCGKLGRDVRKRSLRSRALTIDSAKPCFCSLSARSGGCCSLPRCGQHLLGGFQATDSVSCSCLGSCKAHVAQALLLCQLVFEPPLLRPQRVCQPRMHGSSGLSFRVPRGVCRVGAGVR